MANTKFSALLQISSSFSKKQQELLSYIFDHLQTVSILSASQLSENAGIGKATFFRFLKEAGYTDFAEFRQDIHQYANEQAGINYWQVHKQYDTVQTHTILRQITENSINLLKYLPTPLLESSFDEAVTMIKNAPQIGLLGFRTSRQLALYFENLLLAYGLNMIQLNWEEDFLLDKLTTMKKNGVIFIITRYPYTSAVVKAAEFIKNNNLKIILLTNKLAPSLENLADLVLSTPYSPDIYTIMPYIAVIEALEEALYHQLPQKSRDLLKSVEKNLQEHSYVTW